MAQPDRLASALRRIATLEFSAGERDRRFLLISSGAVGPLVLGLWGAFLPSIWDWQPWVAVVVTLLLGTYQVLLFRRTLDQPQTLGIALTELADAEAALEAERAATSAAIREANRLTVLQSWALSLHAMQGVASEHLHQGTTQEFFEPFLALICAKPENMFGFTHEDIWNFAVYLFDEGTETLRPVWRRTDPRHPSARVADQTSCGRTWRPGIGHVGLAFQRNEALLTEDAAQPQVRALFVAPGESFRDYDETVYRSFASIPFGAPDVAGRGLGVLVGTSSRPGAFDDRTSLPLRHAAAVFTALSLVIKKLPNGLA